MSPRVILHLDMDAFFAAVEERCNPALRGKPLAVTGAGKRTIVVAASYAARLEAFTPLVEPYSVDEAFLDAGGIVGPWGGPRAGPLSLAHALKEAVREETGLTCSVGIGPNKLIAKLASGLRKPDGLTHLAPEEVPRLLEDLPVAELCGIGPATARALSSLGIAFCGQLGRFPEELLVRRFGVAGRVLSRMGRGEDDSPVTPLRAEEEVKSVGHSVTLPQDLVDIAAMERVLLTLSEMVGRRARRYGCAGRCVSLTVRYADFTTFSRQVTLPCPVWTTPRIHAASSGILRGLHLTQPVRLLGVTLGHLAYSRQIPLLPGEARRVRLQEAMDRVNDRYGEFTLGPADLVRDSHFPAFCKRYSMMAARSSPEISAPKLSLW